MAGLLYGFEDGRLGNFVEYDTACFLLVQSKYLTQVPRNSFSLAVFIGSKPYLSGAFGILFKLIYKFLFLLRYLVIRFKRLGVDA